MGEVLEVTKTLVEPAMKLIDVVQAAIGKAYEPRYTRKMADAKAYEIATISSAMRESGDIPIVYDKNDLSLDTTDFDAFIKRTQSRMAYQELQKQQNIENVANRAYHILEGEQKVDNTPINSDWINRLFSYVGDISNEKMQEIWSLILAGEIKRPSSFSLRTLETLHNISQYEAELFQRICCYTLSGKNNIYLPNYNSLLESIGLSYSDILKLDECGLLNSSGWITLSITIDREMNLLARNKSYVIMGQSKNNKHAEIIIKQFPLTSAGMEIINLFNNTTDNKFFIDFANEIKKIHRHVANIQLFEITEQDDEIIEYSTVNILGSNKENNA